jgi:hypothetical protein
MAKAAATTSTQKARMGRPVTYSEALTWKICDRIAQGKSLVSVCKALGLAYSTVARWLQQPEYDDFCNRYARAREDQADYLTDEIVDIADKTRDPQKAKVQIDARKWKAAKLKPKKYGDHVDVELSGSTSHDVWVRLLTEQVAAGRDDAGDDR